MLTEQRYEIILDLLREKKSVTVTELKDILDASESTVRRDITALYKAGRLTRVFGGAVALEHTVNAYEPTVAQKSELNTEEKKKIAAYAASLIQPEGGQGTSARWRTERFYRSCNRKPGHANAEELPFYQRIFRN